MVNDSKLVSMVCVKCKTQKEEMVTKQVITTSRGLKYMWKGTCSFCGTKLCKFTSKDA